MLYYAAQKHIDLPFYEGDAFPEKVLIPIIEWIKRSGVNQLAIGHPNRYIVQSSLTALDLSVISSIQAYYALTGAMHISANDKGIDLLIPDYDCPYCIISGPVLAVTELVGVAQLEGFYAVPTTKFNWWNES